MIFRFAPYINSVAKIRCFVFKVYFCISFSKEEPLKEKCYGYLE